jgi:hypothetical protein
VDSNRTPIRNLAGQKIRDRKETMQFLERGKYVAVVADGKLHLYANRQLGHVTSGLGS